MKFFNNEGERINHKQSMNVDVVPPDKPGENIESEKLILTDTSFSELGFSESIMKGIQAAGFTYCTAIQEKCFPHSLKGKDVAGQAQTGTGKTAAFLISIYHRLEQLSPGKTKFPRALIISPTRELAQQIYEESRVLGRFCNFTAIPVFGGIDYKKQERALREGVDIVVATPGRLIDYMKQKIFIPRNLKILVIDEADRLLDMGFVKDLRYILRRLPPYDQRQSMLFSATLGYRVLELTYEYMNLPVEVTIEPRKITQENVRETLYHVEKKRKLSLLLGLLARNSWERMLFFCNTKSNVEWLTSKLEGNGYSVEGITGDLPQRKRLRIMRRFKEGKLAILVATDVASRGIHVEDIDAVLNYDLPQDPENYVHRIGRTGRVGKTGVALSLADEEYVLGLENIENFIGKKIPVEWAGDDWFLKDQSKRVRPSSRRRKGYKADSRGKRQNTKRRPRSEGNGHRKKRKKPKAFQPAATSHQQEESA